MKLARSLAILRRRFVATVVACTLVSLPTQSLAGPASAPPSDKSAKPEGPPQAKPAAKPDPQAEPTAPPAKTGGAVALMRFSGVAAAGTIRTDVQAALAEAGFTVKNVAIDMNDAAKKAKCGRDLNDDCLRTVGKWLNKNPKTAADYIVWGSVTEARGLQNASVAAYDIAAAKKLDDVTATMTAEDLIVPLVLPKAVATRLVRGGAQAPTLTDEEKTMIAELDEPAKTPEEIRAEEEKLRKAEEEAKQRAVEGLDTSAIAVDLRKDFKAFCRTGPRKKRASRDDPKDLRPACSRGPTWGYWQPRAFVALTLALGAAVGTIAMYSAAAAARGPYLDAVDKLNDAEAGPNDPPSACTSQDQCYEQLASEVSRTGQVMRYRAIVGDALLGTTALLAGILTIIIFQDRNDAKNFIRQEKALKAMSGLHMGPIIGAGMRGMGLGFRF